MRRILAIIVALGVLALLGGFLWIGAFPPKAPIHPVHEEVPVSRLAGGKGGQA